MIYAHAEAVRNLKTAMVQLNNHLKKDGAVRKVDVNRFFGTALFLYTKKSSFFVK